MSKRLSERIRNSCIVVLFVAVIAYCALYGRNRRTAEEINGAEENVEIRDEQGQAAETGSAQSGAAQESLPDGFCDIAVAVKDETGTQQSRLYIEGDSCYFFLPSYAADGESVTWSYDDSRYAIDCGGQDVRNGDMLAAENSGSVLLTIGGQAEGEGKEYQLTVMRSADLPTVYIDGDDFRCVDTGGRTDFEGSLARLTEEEYADLPTAKKSYEFRADQAWDILGLGESADWLLQANAYDLSRMRNKLAYDLAGDMGVPQAVRSAYADVWIDGEYMGNYLLCNRTGETVGAQDDDRGLYTEALEEQIKGCDSEAEYRALGDVIDLGSFAQMYVLDLLANAPDLDGAGRLGPAGDGSGRLCIGLARNYDRAFGNTQEAWIEPLICFAPGVGDDLFSCPYFRQDVRTWFTERCAPTVKAYLEKEIGDCREQIRASVSMDEIRWGASARDSYRYFNNGYDTFDDAVRYVAYYLEVRCELLRQYFDAPEEWHQIEFVKGGSETYESRRYLVRDGEKIPEETTAYLQKLYGCDGWLYEDGRQCQMGRPIYGDMKLISHTQEPQGQENVTEDAVEQETESAGYSKRFVIFCMLFAGGLAGLGGIIAGCVGTGIVLGKKKRSAGHHSSL